MTDESAESIQSSWSIAEAGWERETLEKVLLASVEEQRRARRWGIFFKALLALYLGVALWMAYKPWSGSAAGKDGDGHTAVIDVAGVIAVLYVQVATAIDVAEAE